MIVELKGEEDNIKKKKNNEFENSNIVTGVMEKIGILEKKVEYDKEEQKSLNQRIEDLVLGIEKANKIIKKEFSFKRIFIRGLLQGLGIIIGSTILAGLLYSLSIKFIDKDFIDEYSLQSILDKENKNK